MQNRSPYLKIMISCMALALCVALPACNALKPQIKTAQESAAAPSGSESAAALKPGCIQDLAHWKLRYKPDANCTACHTACVDSMHCQSMGAAWKTTNCQSCHGANPHKGS